MVRSDLLRARTAQRKGVLMIVLPDWSVLTLAQAVCQCRKKNISTEAGLRRIIFGGSNIELHICKSDEGLSSLERLCKIKSPSPIVQQFWR